MSDERRWAQVLERDPLVDGEFLYGVVTTGVYCRPTCPSRRPNRENVRFFERSEQARAAGLRPCRRCEPDGEGPAARQRATVEAACRTIETASSSPSLASLAAAAGMSPSQFRRVFTDRTGVSPKAYADAVRAGRVRRVLEDGSSTVTDAIYGAGFESSGRFYERSTARLGMTPSEYRDGAPDVRVRFAVADTSLGPLLVAATDRGICAIEFGDDAEQLVIGVQQRFRSAALEGDDRDFDALVAQVVGLVERPELGSDLPLDIRGTAFQERVWRALQGVAPGRTVTYSELAQLIGSPTSVRAVAGACAANHLAIAVPCHRVIRRDGSLSGYRWGVERKRALLEREAQPPPVSSRG